MLIKWLRGVFGQVDAVAEREEIAAEVWAVIEPLLPAALGRPAADWRRTRSSGTGGQ